jgi:small-conductance mechanosensitive channel
LEEVKNIWHSIRSVLEFEIISLGDYHLSIYNILFFLFIIALARSFVKLLERLIKRQIVNKKSITEGKIHALLQILKYVVYVVAMLFAVKSIGFDITPLLIGSSALFVGLGFGLQEAFRDFISGLILLFEGDVIIGDVIEFENGLIATVKKIKLRTSKVRTRDGIVIFVPNSQLINNRVINWSNSNVLTRFNVKVGVAYGSDVELVSKLLMQVATEDKAVSDRAKPFVRFADFGNSSLDFELYFWSEEVWRIEMVKSRMRFEIDRLFRENKVNIPFPQRDLHIKSSEVSFSREARSTND